MKEAIKTLEIEVARLEIVKRNYELRQATEGLNQYNDFNLQETDKLIADHTRAIDILEKL